MDTIIGIDLGTSTTEAAVYQDGKPVIMLNFDGKEVTPSVVGLDDSGNVIVERRRRRSCFWRQDALSGKCNG